MHWVFREDITWYKMRFFVKLPLPAENEIMAARLYERACIKGLGVSMEVFCQIESDPYCYIWLPEDSRQAELALVSGLKLSVPTKVITAQRVFNPLLWWALKKLGKSSSAVGWLDRVPERSVPTKEEHALTSSPA